MHSVREALGVSKVLIVDGAFGTQFAARGGRSVVTAVLESPNLVKSIHADYKAAGADIVLANTFAANPISLATHQALHLLHDLNRLGVDLCREAVGDECFVAGDMGPTGKLLEPYGDYTHEQLFECFATQATILAASGADLLMIETMTDVNEAVVAVQAAKSVSSIPVIATMSFDAGTKGFRTAFGQDASDVARMLCDAGADAVGTNCGTVDPAEMSCVIAEMRAATNLPLCAEPNAGKPELADGKTIFRLSPEDFAQGAVKCVEAGSVLVGGCCGTTPAHIEALAARLKT